MMPETVRPTTPDGLPIYRIPESNMDAFNARIAKMNKRAAKLKMDPLQVATVGEAFETRKKTVTRDLDLDDIISGVRPEAITVSVRFVLVTVTGHMPRVNGWAMAATIQHDEAGNILRTVPGFETTLPVVYRTCATACEHCGTARIRKDTYVLQSEENGWKQVGRSCLADFIRTDNPQGLAEYAEMLAGISEDIGAFEEEGSSFGGGRASIYFPALALLAQVACVVRQDGWRSRTEARSIYGKLASVDFALGFFDPKIVAQMKESDIVKYTPTEEDEKRAAAAISWAHELPADVGNDYLWNLRVVSHREQISYREAGLAGSMISAYNRAMEQELKQKYERDNPSQYFGEVGERAIYTLAVIGLHETSNDFGLTTIVRFRDAAGNRATWFASGSPSFEIDHTYTVKATVKAHQEYRGSKQTVITRVAVHVEKPAQEKKARAPRKAKVAHVVAE